MPLPESRAPSRPARSWPAIAVVVAVVGACTAALLFRSSVRSRYWAWRLARAADPAQRSVYLEALCRGGDQARWGIRALLGEADPQLRQYGVLALHHVRTPWARQRLLESVSDPDIAVRRLAAAGLAIHRDDSVIPMLKWFYQAGDEPSASTACLAFERLGSPAAIAALRELALEPAEVTRRAALVDALNAIGKPECVPALIQLLTDHRPCAVPAPVETPEPELISHLKAAGFQIPPTSQTASAPHPATIAERAATALAEITGLHPPFSSSAPADQRAAAAQQWSDWWAVRQRPD